MGRATLISNDDRHDPWVAYVGPFTYPWGSPAARRVHGVSRALAANDRSVVVLADGNPVSDHGDIPGTGISYFGTGELTASARWRRAIRHLFTGGRRARAWINDQPTLPAAITLYGGRLPYYLSFWWWCRRQNVPLLIDVVEWYDPRYVPFGRLGPFSFASMLEHRFLHRFADGVIAISSYLEAYYLRHLSNVVRIPATTDLDFTTQATLPASPDGVVQIGYFGTPGKKEDLSTIIEAALKVPAVQLVVAGPTFDELQTIHADAGHQRVVSLGRVPQTEVHGLMAGCDFTVIVRPKTRSNAAGFPTKFAESMALGVPVIANLVGDVGHYLRDGQNGIVSEGTDVESVAHAFQRAVESSPETIGLMRRESRIVGLELRWNRFIPEADSLLRQSRSPR